MNRYYVNKNAQENGDHEVHVVECTKEPVTNEENRYYLGFFLNCRLAVEEARKIFPTADGCYYCVEECHNS